MIEPFYKNICQLEAGNISNVFIAKAILFKFFILSKWTEAATGGVL